MTTPPSLASAFGNIPIGVAIITVPGDPPHGATGMVWAEALDPPLVLTTLRRTGTAWRLIRECGIFGVSLLTRSQSHLTWQFADNQRSSAARFADVPVTAGPSLGAPLLDGAAACLECEAEAFYPFGSYDIVVGKVRSAREAVQFLPLIHCQGRLWELSEVS